MIAKEKQAAQLLEGKSVGGGWKVIKKIEREQHQTGGVYSCCYEVSKGESRGFLKAFDYSSAEKIGDDFPSQLSNILNAFIYERHILEKCTESGCKNVIKLLDFGNIDVEEAEKYPRVEYLILEYADEGDIRDAIKENKVTLEWKLRSLHQLTKGLSQIHNLSIAHQDIKPSNIVTLKNNIIKITDFGSAFNLGDTSLNLPVHLDKSYSGSWEYAPPELLYGEIDNDSITRRIGCDLYLLGSMIAFYFTNMSMTALIKSNLDDRLCWTNQNNFGKFRELKTYLVMAYELAMEDIYNSIQNFAIKEQVVLIVRYLCHPDPRLRGHEKDIMQIGPNYNLHRFITMFDRMASIVSIQKGNK